MGRDKPVTASERQRRVKTLGTKNVKRKRAKPNKNSTNAIETQTPTQTKPLQTSNETLGESDEDTRDSTSVDVVQGPTEGSSAGASNLNDGNDGGPIDKSVLKSFEHHVAYTIWSRTEGDRGCLRTINHYMKLNDWKLNEEVSEVQSRVARSGLMNLVEYGYRFIDYVAVSAFVERWQPETNTFHLPFGEMTITLDDVKHILGVPVEGDCVYAVDGGPEIDQKSMRKLLVELLGVTPDIAKEETRRHYAVRLEWLKLHFMKKATESFNADELDKCARAYILYTLGCVVFPDKTKSRISVYFLGLLRDLDKVGDYSWGMGILAHLYRQLGNASRSGARQISGCLSLLVAWIYDHFPGYGRAVPNMEYNELEPRICKWKVQACGGDKFSSLIKLREQLDDLKETDVCWDPYKDSRDAHPLQEVSYYSGLVICFDIAEAYYPDRVLRQFGRVQTIPKTPMVKPVTADRGKKPIYYDVVYNLNKWHQSNWRNRLLHAKFRSVTAKNPWDCSSDYLNWYLKITHPIVQIPSLRTSPTRIEGKVEKELSRLKSEVEKAKATLSRYLHAGSNSKTDPTFFTKNLHDILMVLLAILDYFRFINMWNMLIIILVVFSNCDTIFKSTIGLSYILILNIFFVP